MAVPIGADQGQLVLAVFRSGKDNDLKACEVAVDADLRAKAVQTALQLGLHRPFHARKFSSRKQIEPSSVAGREDTQAWLWCHIVSVK